MTCNQIMKEYLFLLWDGMLVFGYDDTKLARLKRKGEKAYFTDKLRNKKYIAVVLIGAIVAILLVLTELSRYGDQKSQSIALMPESKIVYDINQVFNWLGAIYFWMDELVPKIQNFQRENANNSNVFQAPIIRNQRDIDDYSQSEYDFIEQYLCNKTRFFYLESYLNDSYSVPKPFTQYTIYDFKCVLMKWSNDKIRASYHLNIGENKAAGILYDTRTLPEGFDLFASGGHHESEEDHSEDEEGQTTT